MTERNKAKASSKKNAQKLTITKEEGKSEIRQLRKL